MERLVEGTLSKVNILSKLDCYYRLFPLIYISYDPKRMTIQGSCEISFERYLASKKFLSCDEDLNGEVEAEVPKDRVNEDGTATFKVEIHRISKFIVGEPGEPYCLIPVKGLKLLNKFLGMTINNSKTEFCKEDDSNFLFWIEKENYHTNLQLSTKA